MQYSSLESASVPQKKFILMTHPQQLRDKRQLLVLNSLPASAVHKGRDGTEEVEHAALTPTSWPLKAPVLTHGVSSTVSTQG